MTETTRSINLRADAEYWPAIESALESGATLYRPSGLSRYFVVDRYDNSLNTGGLSPASVKRLEREGVLVCVGVDRYGLAT